MPIIDTHTHLFVEEFKADIKETIQRAQEAGVSHFLLPNIDVDTIDDMHALCFAYPGICYPMMGLHPSSVKENSLEELAIVEEHLRSNQVKYVAVGEIGIDLFWDKSFLKEQQHAFSVQVALAKELKLPIVIHVRDSFDEVFEILDEMNDDSLVGVFHCFTGTLEQVNHIVSYGGFKIGLGGVLTFKNSGLDAVIADVDLEHLVLETDSPYLAPVPYRGKRNESGYIMNVAAKLAELKGIGISEVEEITTKNALQIFSLN